MTTPVATTRPCGPAFPQRSPVAAHLSRRLQIARARRGQAHSKKCQHSGTSRSRKTSSWVTDLFRLRLPGEWRMASRCGHHHADGRGPPAAALELQPVLPGLRARRSGVFADSGREVGAGPGRAAQAARAGRKPGRRRAGRQGLGRTRRAGQDRKDERPHRRCRPALDRLHRHQSRPAARAIAWPCAAWNRATRTAPAPTFAPTRWAPASTSCTC